MSGRKDRNAYRNTNKIEMSKRAFVDGNTILKEYGMILKKSKTKVMVMGKLEEINIQIENVEIEQVNLFQYFGIEIESDGNQEKVA